MNYLDLIFFRKRKEDESEENGIFRGWKVINITQLCAGTERHCTGSTHVSFTYFVFAACFICVNARILCGDLQCHRHNHATWAPNERRRVSVSRKLA
jgi:hypothetical protein